MRPTRSAQVLRSKRTRFKLAQSSPFRNCALTDDVDQQQRKVADEQIQLGRLVRLRASPFEMVQCEQRSEYRKGQQELERTTDRLGHRGVRDDEMDCQSARARQASC